MADSRELDTHAGGKGGLIFVACMFIALIGAGAWLILKNKTVSSTDEEAQVNQNQGSVKSFDLENVLIGTGELEFCFPEGQDPNYPGVSACMQGFSWNEGVGYFDLVNAGAGSSPESHGKLSISEIREGACAGFEVDSDLMAYMGVCVAKKAIPRGKMGDWDIRQGQIFMVELFRDDSTQVFFQQKDVQKEEIPSNSQTSNGQNQSAQYAPDLMNGEKLASAASKPRSQSPVTTSSFIHIGDASKALELAKRTQTNDWGTETFKGCVCTAIGNVIELSASSKIVLYNDADGPSVIAYTWEDNHGNPYTHFYQYNGSWVDVGKAVMPGYTGQYNDYFEATSEGITKWRGQGIEPGKYKYRSGIFVKSE